MKKIFFIAMVTMISVMTVHKAYSQETEAKEAAQESITEETVPSEVYTFPIIKPEVSLFGGYRFAGFSGSPRADQYEYLHDSITLGGELRVFSYPHRLHLDVDIKDKNDYFGDISYWYKDMILFRGINRTLWHNLVNIPLIDLDPSTPSPGVEVRDGGVEYGTKTGITTGLLRFKMPDFPFHVYIEGGYIDKSGSMQQRFLGGSGSFNNIVRVSEKRDVDWITKSFLIGANSHLGPIEADFSHGEKRFDVSSDKVLSDFFTAATPRPAGVFAHNLIPDISSSSNTLKLHTSYTGSLVASATLTKIDSENKDSGAKADYFIGSVNAAWLPMPKLSFFVKYRHKDADLDSPGTVSITDISNPSQTFTFPVKAAISSRTDTVSGTVRYRPIPGVALKAEYTFQNVDRENAEAWNLPDSTQRNTIMISADTRIFKGLNFKASYTHLAIDNPAYNTEPDHSDAGRLSLSWVPIPQINAYVSYSFAREKRDNVQFTEPDDTITTAHNRDVNKDMVLGSVTFLILTDLSLTGSYAYTHGKTQQDIEYGNLAGGAQIDPSVPDRETAQTFAVDVNYIPRNNVTLHAGVSRTLSNGKFSPASPDLTEPVSIASFSEFKTRETVFTTSGEYRFKDGFALGIRYQYSKIRDALENPFDDVRDGTAHIVMLTASKRW